MNAADRQLEPIDPAGWAPYLDPGEALLWQGAPARGVRVRPSDLMVSAFGLFFAGFAIFWVYMASSIGGDAPAGIGYVFPLFGLPFVVVGLYLVFGRFLWRAYVRSRTRYALTTRRAIVAKDAFGRSLKSWPITDAGQVEYQPGAEATIFFATEMRRGSKGREYQVRHGFEYIAEGDHVYRLIRAIQQGGAGDEG